MPDTNRPRTIADLPAQLALAPTTPAQAAARYYNTGNAFDVKLPAVPDQSFVNEPLKALHPDTPTCLIPCDVSAQLESATPATTPLSLARYAKIKAGETLSTEFVASGIIVYVISGIGSTTCEAENIEWSTGDVFILPGGGVHVYKATTEADAVLWIVTNEPQLAFENLRAPAQGNAPTCVVHYPADEITRQIDLLYAVGRGKDIPGSALIFSSTSQEAIRNVLPTLTVAMNSLPAGEAQRPHRHNAMAMALIIQGEGCYSIVDGKRKEWSQWATTITPGVAVHSHHNEGNKRAMFLIIQDGGIYYYTRAMGFSFAD
ncbi:cupin domain-containing protein [Glaciimonas immobilis]|uniref:Quercetin dioxygenase-like cupin family protein n=1 Tax=Glaciimonas immobilis TaxID=728004 RepID=A0A840RVH7_9BURK|nr:cupin domain-containing protein [Glaciimonas immobilis]KAF3996469.1 cupin domain-containing protein [Glaciimonas immobilis]MBB5201182.1 quercetin dioxygenase-like cupin family protein [Glaciimonas immobilis]